MLLAIEQEIIRSKSVIEGNFKVNTTENKMTKVLHGLTPLIFSQIPWVTSIAIPRMYRWIMSTKNREARHFLSITYIQLVCRVKIQVQPSSSNVRLTVEQEPM